MLNSLSYDSEQLIGLIYEDNGHLQMLFSFTCTLKNCHHTLFLFILLFLPYLPLHAGGVKVCHQQ